VFVKDFKAVELGMAFNGLNIPIEGQGACIRHHLKSLQNNSKCYKFIKKNYENNLEFCKQKCKSNAPNT
jgi:hypothetical protein